MPQSTMLGEERGDTGNNIITLSERQMQVLTLVAEGATDKEIAL
jgi:DNA-binding NarL/FixJ family response regulator